LASIKNKKIKIKSLLFIILFLIVNAAFSQSEIKKDSTLNSKIEEKEKIENPKEYIKKETIGGKLDFSKLYVGYGAKNAQHKAYLYSIATWTYAVKDLGIRKEKDIIKLWEEIYKRKMKKDEKKAIELGLKSE
jgi:predicted transcriptional regulator YdeE